MRKILALLVPVIALAGILTVLAPMRSYADDADDADAACNGVSTSILGNKNNKGCYEETESGDGVYKILNIILNVLTAGVGVFGVLGLVWTGIQYMSARDNDQQLAAAKKRLLDIVIGLLIYAVMYTVLEWLIPGGII